MRVFVLNSVNFSHTRPTGIYELRIDARLQDETPSNTIDLVLIDAQSMSPETVSSALDWVASLRQTQPLSKVAMLWPNPPIDIVVKSLRAGVNDIIKEPLSWTRLYRLLLRSATTSAARASARSIMATGRLLESMGFTEEEADLANILMRERKMVMRETAMANETKRLEDMRDVLHHREAELRTRAMRLDEEFARMQNDSDLHPHSTAAVAKTVLTDADATIAKQLKSREVLVQSREEALQQRLEDIESRERMLTEYERMLRKRAVAS